MRLLLVAYDFPPVGGIGVQRAVKFARYLPDFGIEPVVLTNRHGCGRAHDAGLLAANGLADVPVFRLGGERLASYHAWRDAGAAFPWRQAPALALATLRYSEVFGLWYHSLRGQLDAFARDQRVDAVLTTTPQASACFFGLHLARSLRLPWLIDVRDSMVANTDRRVVAGVAQVQSARIAGLERQFVAAADQVLTVSQPIIDNMVARCGAAQRHKFLLLPNGFDAADFPAAPALPRNDKLTLVYAGTFTGRRRPDTLVAGINRAIAGQHVDPAQLRLHFYGRFPPDVLATLATIDPAVECRLHGFVPQQEAISAAAAADAVLLVTVPGNDSAAQEVLTGKVYECMGMGKRVLALTDAAPLAALIAQARLGDSCAAGDADAVALALGRLQQDWRRTGSVAITPDADFIARFERRAQAGVLAAGIKQLVDARAARQERA